MRGPSGTRGRVGARHQKFPTGCRFFCGALFATICQFGGGACGLENWPFRLRIASPLLVFAEVGRSAPPSSNLWRLGWRSSKPDTAEHTEGCPEASVLDESRRGPLTEPACNVSFSAARLSSSSARTRAPRDATRPTITMTSFGPASVVKSCC